MFSIFSNKPLSKLSLEELKSREQSARKLYRWSVGFFLGMLALVTFWTAYKGYHSSNVIYVAGLAGLPAVTANKLKKIRLEISSRI